MIHFKVKDKYSASIPKRLGEKQNFSISSVRNISFLILWKMVLVKCWETLSLSMNWLLADHYLFMLNLTAWCATDCLEVFSFAACKIFAPRCLFMLNLTVWCATDCIEVFSFAACNIFALKCFKYTLHSPSPHFIQSFKKWVEKHLCDKEPKSGHNKESKEQCYT